MTQFSVIIATRNRKHQLRRCLEALTNLETPRSAFEIIVVDDGSVVTTAEVVEGFANRLRVKLLRQQRAGPSRARNQGAKAAIGELLAFTDDDCRPRPDWLEQFRLTFDHWGSCLLGGAVEDANKDGLCSLASHLLSYQRYERYAKDPRYAPRLGTLNMSVPKADFLTLGGFDEVSRAE